MIKGWGGAKPPNPAPETTPMYGTLLMGHAPNNPCTTDWSSLGTHRHLGQDSTVQQGRHARGSDAACRQLTLDDTCYTIYSHCDRAVVHWPL